MIGEDEIGLALTRDGEKAKNYGYVKEERQVRNLNAL